MKVFVKGEREGRGDPAVSMVGHRLSYNQLGLSCESSIFFIIIEVFVKGLREGKETFCLKRFFPSQPTLTKKAPLRRCFLDWFKGN